MKMINADYVSTGNRGSEVERPLCGCSVVEMFTAPDPQGNDGCPILRAFCEGWDTTALPPKFSLFNSQSPFSTPHPLALHPSTCYSHRGR